MVVEIGTILLGLHDWYDAARTEGREEVFDGLP